MRLPVAAIALTLLLPASAQAGTVALEGTELVFRADPGQLDDLVVMPVPGVVTFRAAGLVAKTGPASRAARVPTSGCSPRRTTPATAAPRGSPASRRAPSRASFAKEA